MSRSRTSLFAAGIRRRLLLFLLTAVLFIVLISVTAVVGLTRTYGSLADLRDRALGQMFSSMILGVKTAQISTYATRLSQTIDALKYQEESRLLAAQAGELHTLLDHVARFDVPEAGGAAALVDSTRRLAAGVQEMLLQAHQRHILHTTMLSRLHQMMLEVRHVRRVSARTGDALLPQLDELARLLEAAAGSRYSAPMFAALSGEFARLADFPGFAEERAALHAAFARLHEDAHALEAINLRITFLLHQINALVRQVDAQYTELAARQVDAVAIDSQRIQERIYRNILWILVFALLTIAILAVSGQTIYAVIGRRLHSIIEALKQLAAGNRDITVPQQQRQDEIGDLARAFNVFHQNVILLEQTDSELKEKSAWLAQTFLAMRDGLAIFDAEQRLIACNSAFRALLPGFVDDDDTTPRTLADLVAHFRAHQATAAHAAIDLEALGKIRGKDDIFDIEYRRHILEWRVSPRPEGLVAILIDRTQRRQLETDLAHSQRMHTIGHITGGIAHDFNNLLAVIIGNLDLVDPDALPGNAGKHVRRALQAAENSATLTQRLLAYARKQPLHPRALDIHQLVTDFVQLIRHTLPPGIELHLDLADKLPPVYMDKNQLETALMNLIVNAKDAIAGHGYIRIRGEARLVARRHREEHMLQLSVSDDGCGMSDDTRERIFEPFFTTKSGGKGSGLGLSMVYGFIRQSKGRVLVESAPGQGSTIHLQLPLAARRPDAETPSAKHAPRPGGGSILLVEDQPALRDTLAEQLAGLGYTVHPCADGDSALALLQQGLAIDCLLSDIVLPGRTSGVQLAEYLRSTHPATRIVLMTGHYDAHDEASPFTILKKPFKTDALQAVLHDAAK